MASDGESVPKVSIAVISAKVCDSDIDERCFRDVGKELVKAFTDVGFCYIKDHGIDKGLYDKSFEVGERFFDLPLDVKKRRLRPNNRTDIFGWLPLPNTPGIDATPEFNHADTPADFKEVYNLSYGCDVKYYPTDEEVPDFRKTTLHLIEALELIFQRILIAVGFALELSDPKGFCKSAAKVGTKDNNSVLRYAYYPLIPPTQRQENQLRCTEHTDFGHVTFLVNNGISGLEILTRNGDYLKVSNVEDAILLNVGDSFERMSGGILRSAPHRVTVSDETAGVDRYSVLFFAGPDEDAYLDPLCGTKERYREKITFGQFVIGRMKDIFEREQGVIKHTTD